MVVGAALVEPGVEQMFPPPVFFGCIKNKRRDVINSRKQKSWWAVWYGSEAYFISGLTNPSFFLTTPITQIGRPASNRCSLRRYYLAAKKKKKRDGIGSRKKKVGRRHGS